MSEVQYQDTVEEISEPQEFVLASRAAKIAEIAGQGGGKTRTIGISTGMMASDFPQVRGFIGANTNMQLSQSTLVGVYKAWKEIWGYTMYHPKSNPRGAFVIDRMPPPHFKKLHDLGNRYNGTISFHNGAMIFIGSLENYMAHDGKEFGYAHLDETKDTKMEAVTEVIEGRLRQFGLWYDQAGVIWFDDTIDEVEAEARHWTGWNPLYIHTSPAKGGVEWLNEMFDLRKHAKDIKKRVLRKEKDFFRFDDGDKAVCVYSSHHNQPNLPPNYITNREKNAPDFEKVLRVVYGYPFGKTGGEYYPTFRRDQHVKSVPFMPGVGVLTTWDFNVVPFMTLICAQLEFVTRYLSEAGEKHYQPQPGDKAIQVMRIRIYREYCLVSPENTTDACCEHFIADHEYGIDLDYYGDASGRNRIPGLGSLTNYSIIEDKLYRFIHNDSMKVKGTNISPLKRRDLLNKILGGKIPYIELEVDEACEQTIEDFEHVKLGPLGKVKEKVKDEATGAQYEKRGHPTDAVEYLVCELARDYID